MKEMKERALLEAALENTEVVVDQFISNDLVKDIPFVGTALKACKAVADIRDRLFLAKISRFLTELNSVRLEIKEALKEKMTNNTEEAKKIGEVVLLVPDKVSDLEKPEILAKIFLAHIDNQVTFDDFRRITEAVSQAFVDDLRTLIDKDSIPSKSQEAYLRYLTITGLTEIVSEKIFDEMGNLYELNELGRNFLEACLYNVFYA
jgi:hypothetical protein